MENKLRVAFCTSNMLGGILIRIFTWSPWSHVAIVDGDYVIEATWPRVQISTLESLQKRHKKLVFKDYFCYNPRKAIDACKQQVGKKYDLFALFGFLFHRNWQDDKQWFCSELVAWALEQGGSPRFDKGFCWRITPQNLWMLHGEKT